MDFWDPVRLWIPHSTKHCFTVKIFPFDTEGIGLLIPRIPPKLIFDVFFAALGLRYASRLKREKSYIQFCCKLVRFLPILQHLFIVKWIIMVFQWIMWFLGVMFDSFLTNQVHSHIFEELFLPGYRVFGQKLDTLRYRVTLICQQLAAEQSLLDICHYKISLTHMLVEVCTGEDNDFKCLSFKGCIPSIILYI